MSWFPSIYDWRAISKSIIIIAFLLTGCTMRPFTHYLESPYYNPSNVGSEVEQVELGCLDLTEIKTLMKNGNPQQELPRLIYYNGTEVWDDNKADAYMNKLHNIFENALNSKFLACSQTQKSIGTSLLDQGKSDHQGLRITDTSSQEQAEAKRRDIFTKVLGQSDGVSVSYGRPASLALSARRVEELSAPSSAFSRLPERAQAAILALSAEFSDNWKDKTPDKAAGELLSALSPKGDTTFSESQRVELTISSAFNSAGVDDRLDYVAAYVIIPPLPKVLNRGFHLEESFLKSVRALSMGRRPNERRDWIEIDVNRAINQLKVRFEDVEKPQTIVAPLDLGTLQSSLGLTAEETATVAKHLGLNKITQTMQEVRTDKLSKEIERRSAWIDPERTMLRVTQRGHEAVSVAGTITQNITLHIPRGDLLLLRMETVEKDIKKNTGTPDKVSVSSVSVSNVMQPLYAAVDGLALIISTVRVAVPTVYPFIKEPNGYAMTIVEGPLHVRLWERRFSTFRLDASDLFANLSNTAKGKLAVMVEASGAVDYAQFASHEEAIKFRQQLGKSIGLQKVTSSDTAAVGIWLKIFPCADSKSGNRKEWKDEIERKDIAANDLLLGVEDFNGIRRGFLAEEINSSIKCPDN